MTTRDPQAPIDPTTTVIIPGERIATALRRSLRKGYGRADFAADLLAGLVVGVVALPLSMALAIASGVPPQYGLYTAIVGGTVIALLGGSKVQVSGPTAAFVVILAPIASAYGIGGLLLASLMAGVLLVALGLAKLGDFIQFVPSPVTTGFTAGIAVVIATLQVKDLFGLTVERMPTHYLDRIVALARALPTARWQDAAIGALTLAVILAFPLVTKKVPAPLVALAFSALVAELLRRVGTGFDVETIAERFTYVVDGVTHGGIPRLPPLPAWPWNQPGPDGAPFVLSLELVRELLPAAFAIAMLGAIESLLSAVIADSMTGKKHDPNGELLAQGVGNIVAPFFGGFAATGAIARTATNIRAGARTPIAAVVHAHVVLLAVVLFAPLLGYLPMAALAAQLVVVAWTISEAKHVARVVRIAPRADVTILFVCFFLTVVFDMVVAVTVGIVLAAFLFMQRMAALSEVKLVNPRDVELDRPLPPTVVLYEIAGPLFFGAAQKAMTAIRNVSRGVRSVVLDVRSVPMLDATGLVALESTVAKLHAAKVMVVLAGVQHQPLRVLARAGWRNRDGELAIGKDFDRALEVAIEHAESPASTTASATGQRRPF